VNAAVYGLTGFQRLFLDQNLLDFSNKMGSVRHCLDLLKLSSKALLFDPRELAGQILGRIHSKITISELSKLRQGAENWLQFSKESRLLVARPLVNWSSLTQVNGILKLPF
jgi:hypothetical protein